MPQAAHLRPDGLDRLASSHIHLVGAAVHLVVVWVGEILFHARLEHLSGGGHIRGRTGGDKGASTMNRQDSMLVISTTPWASVT